MYLADDLINEILYFLPLKSLIRFKGVCRSWNSMIKEQCATSLLIRSRNNCARSKLVTSLLRYDHNTNLKSCCNLDHQQPPFGAVVRVVGQCNGIICTSISRFKKIHIELWNSSMTESRSLPPSLGPYCRSLYLDPAIGFHFDSHANDYKVVKLRKSIYQDNYFRVEIYSTAENSWSTYESCNYLIRIPAFEGWAKRALKIRMRVWINSRLRETSSSVAVIFSKYCCWLAKGLVGGEIILSFDMSRKVFVYTLLPSALQPAGQTSQILDMSREGFLNTLLPSAGQTSQIFPFRDSLALVVGSDSSEGSTFQIWTIKDLKGEGSWNKMATIGPLSGRYRSLAFWKNYDSLILEDLKCNGLMSYDLRLHKTKEIGIDVAGMRLDMASKNISTISCHAYQ